ncbi:MAG TPA: hypothetical protein VG711_00060 [Phycisphaerales bacterium]|nr:hypothetical protein [Phycisphaerales bacterium]
MSRNEKYVDCYVAFLDVLGFRQLVEESESDLALLQNLSKIAALAASPQSGRKVTNSGDCTMEVRSFSDTFVAFTPVEDKNSTNPLAQLCFVVRYIHDQMLNLGVCIRGGISQGNMYWHPSWSMPPETTEEKLRIASRVTLGPGLNAAYDLENKQAIYPRVLVAPSLVQKLKKSKVSSNPFANSGKLYDALRSDPGDQMMHLDLLNMKIARHEGETMTTLPSGFTVEWKWDASSSHADVLEKVEKLAKAGMNKDKSRGPVWQKYKWLAAYCMQCKT